MQYNDYVKKLNLAFEEINYKLLKIDDKISGNEYSALYYPFSLKGEEVETLFCSCALKRNCIIKLSFCNATAIRVKVLVNGLIAFDGNVASETTLQAPFNVGDNKIEISLTSEVEGLSNEIFGYALILGNVKYLSEYDYASAAFVGDEIFVLHFINGKLKLYNASDGLNCLYVLNEFKNGKIIHTASNYVYLLCLSFSGVLTFGYYRVSDGVYVVLFEYGSGIKSVCGFFKNGTFNLFYAKSGSVYKCNYNLNGSVNFIKTDYSGEYLYSDVNGGEKIAVIRNKSVKLIDFSKSGVVAINIKKGGGYHLYTSGEKTVITYNDGYYLKKQTLENNVVVSDQTIGLYFQQIPLSQTVSVNLSKNGISVEN